MLRPATLDDLPSLQEIENRCFSGDRISRRQFRYLLSHAHAATLVDEEKGRVCGYVIVLFSRATSMARIYSIAVLPECAGRGIGKALVLGAEEAAQARDRASMRLEIRADNPASQALFERLGYRRFGRILDYYEDHMAAHRYEKSLAPVLELERVAVPFYAQTLDFTCGPASLMMAMKTLSPSMAMNRKLELRLWREATTIFMTSGHGGCGPHGLALAAARRGFRVEIFVNTRDTLLIDSVRNEEKKTVMQLVQEDMEEQARKLGIPIHQQALDVAGLQARFEAGGVPLVLISSWAIYRERFPHWVVVTGFDRRFVYVHDPFIDMDKGETVADCINMPIARQDFDRMARYGRSGQKAVVVIYPAAGERQHG